MSATRRSRATIDLRFPDTVRDAPFRDVRCVTRRLVNRSFTLHRLGAGSGSERRTTVQETMEHFAKTVFEDAAPADAPRGRDSLFLAANLRIKGEKQATAVRVRNLSAGGLMAELPIPVNADAAIEIEVRGLGWVAGRVAWQTEGRIGVAFDKAIDPHRARKPVGTGGRRGAALGFS